MVQIDQNVYNGDMSRTPKVDLVPIIGTDKINFPLLCRAIREEAGFTQTQMAEELGLSATGYGDLERGTSKPSAETFVYLLAIRAKRRSVNLKALFF